MSLQPSIYLKIKAEVYRYLGMVSSGDQQDCGTCSVAQSQATKCNHFPTAYPCIGTHVESALYTDVTAMLTSASLHPDVLDSASYTIANLS